MLKKHSTETGRRTGGSGRLAGTLAIGQALSRLTVLVALGAAAPAHPAVHRVTSLADSRPESLRQAMAQAASGDSIQLDVSGTIRLTSGELAVTKDLTLIGPGRLALAIDDTQSGRILNIHSNVAVLISGLSMVNGQTVPGEPRGAIYNAGDLSVTHCLIRNNTTGDGGTNNDSGGWGGGIYTVGPLRMDHSILSDNPTGAEADGNMFRLTGASGGPGYDGRGGGVYSSSSGACGSFLNTIVARNTGEVADVAGAFLSLGHNLIGVTDGSSGFSTSGDLTGSAASPLDPRMGPLANNGGPTPTIALLSGSAAIDAGDTVGEPTTDQGGHPRPVGPAPDIGAYESGATVTACTAHALRTAMAGGGTVRFACDGTITLTNTITVMADTVLDGTGHHVTISGGDAVRVFCVATNVSFEVLHLTIAHGLGQAGGGVLNDGGSFRATRCTFVANRAVGGAGAGYSGNPGTNGYGGAVYNWGVLNAIDCAFISNSAVGGAGAIGWPGGAGGDGHGGAIANEGTLILSGCLLTSNSARGGAGGPGMSGNYGPWNGTPGGPGGPGGSGNGGALFNRGTAVIVNTTVAQNLGAGGQGGQGGSGGPPSNQSAYSGDGGPGSSGGSGYGGIVDVTGQCYLTNCTLAENESTAGAGGAGGPPGPYPYPYPPRIGQPGANGASGPPGSGLKMTGAQLLNTLVSGNTPRNCIGPISDLGHNLSSDTSCAFTNVGSLNNTDARLAQLADNGGPTLTMALLPGSPALDAGNTAAAPPTDQRGQARPLGLAADIGAYEYGSRPRLQITPPQDGHLRIRLWDLVGNCRLLASTNLTEWVPLACYQIGPDGTALFVVEVGSAEGHRFYRVAAP